MSCCRKIVILVVCMQCGPILHRFTESNLESASWIAGVAGDDLQARLGHFNRHVLWSVHVVVVC